MGRTGTARRARGAIDADHRTFHRLIGQRVVRGKGKDTDKTIRHGPGYEDAVASVILARFDEVDEQLTRIERRVRRGRTRLELPSGVCVLCGCTDEVACPEGCAWFDRDHLLCSSHTDAEKNAVMKAIALYRKAFR